jgi:hypothetical protein
MSFVNSNPVLGTYKLLIEFHSPQEKVTSLKIILSLIASNDLDIYFSYSEKLCNITS